MKTTTEKYWVHILWWAGAYLFWIMIFQKRAFALSSTVTIQFCYLVFIAANFYYNILFIIPRFLYRQRYLEYVVLFLAGITLTALLLIPIAAYLNRNYFFPNQAQPSVSAIFIVSFLNIFIWSACIVAGKLIIERFRFQQYVDEMKKEKAKAELDLLNAQLNPHFLFNSLNSIYGNIDKQNTVARNMVLSFSEMLRYQLYDCNSNTINIDKEINYLKNYIALQQTRHDDTLVVDFCASPDVKNFTIAPLLFIGFIENSFKYVGNRDDEKSNIQVSFKKNGESLFFRCFNTKGIDKLPDPDYNGIGIKNVKRRLELHYKNKHELNIFDKVASYEINLEIELT